MQKRWLKEESGSFTLEAVFMMPMIFLLTIGLLLNSVYTFRSGLVTHSILQAAERAAFTWDNSHKDLVTGGRPIGQTDGLYWRVTGDNVSDWFRWLSGSDPVTVSIPDEASKPPVSLVERKLTKASKALSQQGTGYLQYINLGWSRSIHIAAQSPGLHIPMPWRKEVKPGATGSAVVVDPVEWIRTVDLLRTYVSRWQEGRSKLQGLETTSQETGQPDQQETKIQSEREAAAFIRELVGGKETSFPTTIGTYRKIDALDADGVAHEAKYTVNVTDAMQQIDKDVELIREGKVKGVVWHFFRNQKTGVTGLTDRLKNRLTREGIIYVIHN